MLGLDMRIVFMGSPHFSVPCLKAIASEYEIVGVFTQPDRPSGRGRKVQASAVKEASLQLNLPVFTPKNLRQDDSISLLKGLAPDLIIVVAFGQILPQEVLDIPSRGSINVHASLLPKWRGAAPVHASILNGDSETGVTIMLMDAGMDTGPILTQERALIGEEETCGSLTDRLSDLGAKLLLATLPKYIAGDITPIDQDDSLATYAGMIKKAQGLLDFNLPAAKLARQIRAFEPWPSSFFFWHDMRIVVKQAICLPSDRSEIGLVLEMDNQPGIVTSDGILVLTQVQPAGKKGMTGDAFLRGSPALINSYI
jgi:methionyl-tRNA formyltransferase